MARSCGAAGRAEHGDARAESAPLKLAFEHGVSALGMVPRSDRVEHHDTPSYMRPEATSALSIDRCSPHWGRDRSASLPAEKPKKVVELNGIEPSAS